MHRSRMRQAMAIYFGKYGYFTAKYLLTFDIKVLTSLRSCLVLIYGLGVTH
jgi:hypothetical protein